MGLIRTAISLLILQKQVELMLCSKPTLVTVREGDKVDFTCKYPAVAHNNPKFFCQATPVCKSHLIGTFPPELWETNGRFSLRDNISTGQFMVHMDRLDPTDSGTYWCGVKMTDNPDYITVFQLNVTQTATTRAVETLKHHSPGSPLRPDILVDKHNLPVFVAVASCLSALVIVFLFTLCLIFTVKNRGHARQRARAREMSEDYVVMKSGVLPEPCSCPDFEKCSNNPQNPPPGVCRCTDPGRPKQSVSFALETLTEENVPGLLNQYQDLDLSSVEEHIYRDISSKPAVRDGQEGRALDALTCF